MPATRTNRAAAAAKAKATKAAKKAAAEAEAEVEEAKVAGDTATGQTDEEEEDQLQSSDTDDGKGGPEETQPIASSSRAEESTAEAKAGQESENDMNALSEDATNKGQTQDKDEKMEPPGLAAERESTEAGELEKAEKTDSQIHKKTRQASAEGEKSAEAGADTETEMQDEKREEGKQVERESTEGRPEEAQISGDDTSHEPRGTRRRRSESPNGDARDASPQRGEAEDEPSHRAEESGNSPDGMHSEAKDDTHVEPREEESYAPRRNRRERKRPRLILDETEVAGALEREGRRARRQRRGEEDNANDDEAEKERAAARAADEDASKEQSADVEPSTAATKSETAKPVPQERPKAARRRAPGGMLGLLNSTLSKAREENDKRNSGDAAKRRADLESRLADKLKRESVAIHTVSAVDRALRADKMNAFRLAEAIASGEAEHRSIRAQKRRLASFLVTKGIDRRTAVTTAEAVREGEGPQDAKSLRRSAKLDRDELVLVPGLTLGKGAAISPDVPSSLPPVLDESTYGESSRRDVVLPEPGTLASNELATYPVYYLPKKLTAMQEDLLDDQEDEVDDGIEDADSAWFKKREELEEELDEVLGKIREAMDKKVDVEQKAGLPAKARPLDDVEMKEAKEEAREVPREEAREAERHDDLPSPGGAKADD